MKIEITLNQPGTVSIDIDTNEIRKYLKESTDPNSVLGVSDLEPDTIIPIYNLKKTGILHTSLHGKRVQGGIAIGPYDFADGKTGYIVVAPSSRRYDNNNLTWCLESGDTDGLTRDTNNNWIDSHAGIDNTKHLATTRLDGKKFPAAIYCYSLYFEKCNDYFLPNKNELEYIYEHRDLIDSLDETGNLDTGGICYWSSSEYSNYCAWGIRFSDGHAIHFYKTNNQAILPIRRILI